MNSILIKITILIGGIISSSLFSVDTMTEKPIVAVVCSYNNHKWTNNTLDSIFSQNYSNFRLIIVDDCSSDNNQEIIQNYIDENALHDRVTFIKNNKRHRKLFNLYHALYLCDDDEIVVMVDGDDYLAHSNVFSQLNSLYDDEDIWFTYGQYRNVPACEAVLWGHKEMGYCRPIPKRIVRKQAYRDYSFVYMHLRTFRGWLFKLVKLEDLIAEKIEGFEGDFYPASNDVAMYFPMVEMAHKHIKFIPDILYIRNLYSDIVGFKIDRKIQVASAREIRKKPIYPIIFNPNKNRLLPFKDAKADIFILCQHSLYDIANSIENIQNNIESCGIIHVFFNDTIENRTFCRKIKQLFPSTVFISYGKNNEKLLKNRLLDSLYHSKNNHFILTTDSFSFHEKINASELIVNLEQTYASRFYLNRDSSRITTHFLSLKNDVCAWKFSSNIEGWRGINSLNDMTLYRKDYFLNRLNNTKFDSVHSLIGVIHQLDSCDKQLGLFFKKAKTH